MKMGEKKVCACGNSIDYKPDDDYHLLGTGDQTTSHEEQTQGRCKDCLENDVSLKVKSNDRAFQTGWSVMKAQKTPCNPPCTPREMIGRSWWKNLGYNSPCGCAHEKQSQGHEYMSDHYKEGEDA